MSEGEGKAEEGNECLLPQPSEIDDKKITTTIGLEDQNQNEIVYETFNELLRQRSNQESQTLNELYNCCNGKVENNLATSQKAASLFMKFKCEILKLTLSIDQLKTRVKDRIYQAYENEELIGGKNSRDQYLRFYTSNLSAVQEKLRED